MSLLPIWWQEYIW